MIGYEPVPGEPGWTYAVRSGSLSKYDWMKNSSKLANYLAQKFGGENVLFENYNSLWRDISFYIHPCKKPGIFKDCLLLIEVGLKMKVIKVFPYGLLSEGVKTFKTQKAVIEYIDSIYSALIVELETGKYT